MPILNSDDYSALPAFAGQVTEHNLTNIDSGQSEGAVGMGLGVSAGAIAKHYHVPDTDGEAILGFSAMPLGGLERSDTYAQDANGNYEYPDDTSMSILDFGIIAVRTEGSPAFGDPVYVRHTADGGNTTLGICAPAAGTGLDLVPGCRYEGAATNGIASIRVRLT